MRKYSHAMIICSLMAALSLALAGSQVSAAPLSAGPVGTAFTYQGQLKDGSGNPITATCDFQFGLYDALASGSLIGSMQEVDSVTVTNGYFTSSLDFGAAAFGGDARWLEIAVKCPPDGGFTTLTPRQPLTPAPYSLYALNAGLLNNLPSTSFQQHYQNLVVVAKSGGDYTTISAALASITNASSTNRFLIYVAPGTYTEQVTMKSWVDIEGAGELMTKITYAGSGSGYTGTVNGADNAELRFLTVENTGGTTNAVAIHDFGASPRLTHITVTASGGGYNYGVYNEYSSPTITNVTITASGGTSVSYGVVNDYSSPTMMAVTVTASGGNNAIAVRNDSSSPTIQYSVLAASGGSISNDGIRNNAPSGSYTVKVDDSRITATTCTLRNDSHFTIQVGASQLGGGGSALASGGTLICVFSYNGNYVALNSSCQP